MQRLHIAWLAAVVGLGPRGVAHARVTRFVIDEVQPPPEPAGSSAELAYEQIAGRAFSELDPARPGKTITAQASRVLR
jgi:hypothetical protein